MNREIRRARPLATLAQGLTPAAAAVLVAVGAPLAAQGTGIRGTAHDFSAAQWNGTEEICRVCHVPHGRDAALAGEKLLWNHSLSNAVYELYSSPTLDVPPTQPQGVSRLCLGCHDGTVALDAFDGRSGMTYIEGDARLGIDLSRTHPISIPWEHQGTPDCARCHDSHGGSGAFLSTELVFYDGRVECATCHDPHGNTPANPGGEHCLRLPLRFSELCLECHR